MLRLYMQVNVVDDKQLFKCTEVFSHVVLQLSLAVCFETSSTELRARMHPAKLRVTVLSVRDKITCSPARPRKYSFITKESETKSIVKMFKCAPQTLSGKR